MDNVIEFPAMRRNMEIVNERLAPHLYRCIYCRNEHRFAERQKFAVYCQYDGAEMRPVVEAEVR